MRLESYAATVRCRRLGPPLYQHPCEFWNLGYGESFKDTCVIVTNGTGGNIFENKFLRIMGDDLARGGISFIYAHNSGAFQMIDLHAKSGRSGVTFEMFDNCVEDLQAYVDFAKAQGYKKVILGGHSYGCNKVIYYLHKNPVEMIDSYILISPVDTELFRDSEKQENEKFNELAKEFVRTGKGKEIIPMLYDGYNFFTADTFIDYVGNPHHKNLPVYHDKSNFAQLQSIKLRGLFVMGEFDVFGNGDVKKHLSVINDNSYDKNNVVKIIDGTGHTFKKKERELAEVVEEFVKLRSFKAK